MRLRVSLTTEILCLILFTSESQGWDGSEDSRRRKASLTSQRILSTRPENPLRSREDIEVVQCYL